MTNVFALVGNASGPHSDYSYKMIIAENWIHFLWPSQCHHRNCCRSFGDVTHMWHIWFSLNKKASLLNNNAFFANSLPRQCWGKHCQCGGPALMLWEHVSPLTKSKLSGTVTPGAEAWNNTKAAESHLSDFATESDYADEQKQHLQLIQATKKT